MAQLLLVITSSDQQPNPSTASTWILPGFEAVKEATSIERYVYIPLKNSEIRWAVSENDSHPSGAVSNNSKHKQVSEPAELQSQNPAGRTKIRSCCDPIPSFRALLIWKNDRYSFAVRCCKIRPVKILLENPMTQTVTFGAKIWRLDRSDSQKEFFLRSLIM